MFVDTDFQWLLYTTRDILRSSSLRNATSNIGCLDYKTMTQIRENVRKIWMRHSLVLLEMSSGQISNLVQARHSHAFFLKQENYEHSELRELHFELNVSGISQLLSRVAARQVQICRKAQVFQALQSRQYCRPLET